MVSDAAAPPPFTRHGPVAPAFPVVIAVPHAGRHYAPSLVADAAVSLARLRLLEDRHADLLVSLPIERGATVFIAEHARAWIDFNRDPREIDIGMIDGPVRRGPLLSGRARHGLGLIPRHIGGGGELWKRKFHSSELERRIEDFHRPYHEAIAAALSAARARFGIAILIDCHSMPPLRPQGRDRIAPAIVVGDRFNRSAEGALGDVIESIARRAGFPAARNTPYAGGYSLDLHGNPGVGIHALQVEIDRGRYLDPDFNDPGEGLSEVQALMARIFEALCDEAPAIERPIAAE